jgi:hypothetical protein
MLKKLVYFLFSIQLILLSILFPNTANAGLTTSLTLVINPYLGGLAISVPGTAVFTPIISPEIATNATLELGNIWVTDTRRSVGATGSWVANAVSTNLMSGTETATALSASAFGYSSGLFVKTGGTALMTENTRTALNTSAAVVTTTGITGNHVVTWTPSITVPIPASQVSGTYIGTLTHSVS